MKKVAVITNFNIPEKAKAALSVIERLHELGCGVAVASFNRDRIARNCGERTHEYIEYITLEKLYTAADLIVLLGGDGTILEAARRAVPANKPMFGINLGRLGYMAEIELSELDRLSDVINGNYEIDERMMIRVEIIGTDGKPRFVTFALNDAVVSNGSIARIVDIELYEGGVEISKYRADGMIVATPTGSTAYSMSAGGAILDPRLKCICVTPICPHALASRALIFPECSVIDIKNICQREKVLFLTIDGKSNYEIAYGETVRIMKCDMTAKLIRLKHNAFYKKLRDKVNSNM